jgi:amino acid transporter
VSVDIESGSADRLRALGYEQGLRRNLSVAHVVGLAMADASPTMSVLLLTAGCFVIGGTFAIGASVLLALVVMLIALCLGELASIYPLAGGMYCLVDKILPKPMSWIAIFNYLLQGVVIPASLALGIGVFLRDLLPGVIWPDWLIAGLVLTMAAAITVTRVEVGAWVTLAMVIVEVVVLGIVTVAAFRHPQRSIFAALFHPVMLSSGVLAPLTLTAGVATLAPAFNVINGYDASLGFAEELKGDERNIGKAVIISALLASLLIIVPLAAAVVAAPGLQDFLSDKAPVIYSVQQSLGSSAHLIVDIGVIIALFNSTISLFMYYARGCYATGRDRMWPPAISRKLAELNRFGAPGWGLLALYLPACALIFLSGINWLIVFSGTIIATVYFFIGLAALWSRIAQRGEQRVFRMPLWPLPPLIVTGFTGFALVEQETKYLTGELILIGVALLCWLGSKVWSDTRPVP